MYPSLYGCVCVCSRECWACVSTKSCALQSVFIYTLHLRRCSCCQLRCRQHEHREQLRTVSRGQGWSGEKRRREEMGQRGITQGEFFSVGPTTLNLHASRARATPSQSQKRSQVSVSYTEKQTNILWWQMSRGTPSVGGRSWAF